MYRVSTPARSHLILYGKQCNNCGDQTINMNHILYSYVKAPAPINRGTLRISLRRTCGGHSDVSGSYLRIRDLGEHGGQALGQQHCSPALQQELRWIYRLIPNHTLPLFLPAATLPPLCPSSSASSSFSLSVCLPACAGAVYRTGPQWPWVINGHYGADGVLPSTVVCCSLLSPLLSTTTLQAPKDTLVVTAALEPKTAPPQWREPTLQLGYIN